MLKSMLVGFLVAVFAVFAVVGPVEGQTPREREAFSAMSRAVQAAGSDSSPRALAEARRAIERAFSVFEAQERARDAAEAAYHTEGRSGAEARSAIRGAMRYAELLGQSTAAFRAFENAIPRIWDGSGYWRMGHDGDNLVLETCERDYGACREIESAYRSLGEAHGRDTEVHVRYLYAAAEAFRGAADGLDGVASGVVGFNVRHRSDLQRLASAKLALIRAQGPLLRGVCRTVGCNEPDEALSGLVNAAVAVAGGLASYREAREVAAEIEASRAPLPPRAPAPAVEAPAVEEEVEEVSLADLWLRGVEEALQEADARVSALAERTCGWGSDVTWARIRINNAFDVIHAGFVPGAGGQRFVPPDDVRRPFAARLDGLRERLRGHERRISPSCP